MKLQQFKGSYPMKEGTGINVCLSIILYKEERVHYAYCAALDILGYGYTAEEAKQSFAFMLEEILTDAVANGNLGALLAAYGWEHNQPPKTSALISSNKELADIIDKKAYRTIHKDIILPCA